MSVRRREEISLRAMADRTGISIAQIRQQERETSDILLSDLYKWQRALGVPFTELLVEQDCPLSPPVLNRAWLLRLMRTARTILDETKQSSIRRLAQTLANQVLEMMPELRDIGRWQHVGQPRRDDEYGRAADRAVPDIESMI